jgi:putative transposase
MILAVVVLPADLSDGQGAQELLKPVYKKLTRMKKVWLDAGYQDGFVGWLTQLTGWNVEVVRRSEQGRWGAADQPPPQAPSGFQVLPFRWIVERTFGWLGRFRRLSKDYEETTSSAEAWIWLAMSRVLLARLADGARL